MKKTPVLKRSVYLLSILLFASSGCHKEILEAPISGKAAKAKTDGIYPQSFNWETVDWMPTPAGQAQIPPPWIGQGSIAAAYGPDVVNDHKAIDGWTLLYSTFDANAAGPLSNPYFVLYNRFRGLMRIYYYTTTPLSYPSTYIVDGMSIVSGSSTSLLNYVGTDMIDPTQYQTSISKIEPAPTDGSQPLASNKWYMLQYEMAYDPQIGSHTSSDMQLSWFMNYNSIATISLGGTETGTIKSPTAAPTSTLNPALQKGGTVAGTGALAIVGQGLLKSVTTPGKTDGSNTIGLSNTTFLNIAKGVAGAISAAAGGIPGAIVGIFSAIIGGSSSAPTVNLNFNSTITLNGTQATVGSFPSSPTSVYIPGTNILSSAQNYIPLSNDPLGVFNLTARPTITAYRFLRNNSTNYPGVTTEAVTYSYNTDTNYSLLALNPSVINNNPTGATVINETMEPIVVDPLYNGLVAGKVDYVGSHTILTSSQDLEDSVIGITTEDYPNLIFRPTQPVAVRVTLTISPNANSDPSHYITLVKTFVANLQVVVQ